MHPLLDPPAWVGDRLHRLLTHAGVEPGLRWVRAAVWALLVVAVLGFLVQGANRPADPYLTRQHLPGYTPPASVSHP